MEVVPISGGGDERVKRMVIGDVDYFRRLAKENNLLISISDNAHILDALVDMRPFLDTPTGDEKTVLQEAIVMEYWNEFFTSPNTSFIHREIRERLLLKKELLGKLQPDQAYLGKCIPFMTHAFKCSNIYQWIDNYFGNWGNQKSIYTLYFAKFHHCSDTPIKLSVLLHNFRGGCTVIEGVENTCPSPVCSEFYNKVNTSDYSKNRLFLVPTLRDVTKGSRYEDRVLRPLTPHGYSMVQEFYYDEETDERRVRIIEQLKSSSVLAASITRCGLEDIDPNIRSKFIILSEHGSLTSDIQLIIDQPQLQEEHRDFHRIYFMVEDMSRRGVFHIDMAIARTWISETVLEPLHQTWVIEISRCMCIAYAIWHGLTSKEALPLQYEPITKRFVGFNPRLLCYGILPKLVITSEIVQDAMTLLSHLWEHK